MKYPAIVSNDEGTFVVEFPGLEGCLTEGSSFEDALTNAHEALDGWLESNYVRNLSVKDPVTCFREIPKSNKEDLVFISVHPVLALAYLMRFSRIQNGNKTLREVAGLMKLTQQNYSKIFEDPKANPTLDTIEKGLNELGYSLDLNIVRKSETSADVNLKKSQFKIGSFALPELKRKKA